MLTLDGIRNVEFTRGRGYRAEEVDDFIDACEETVQALMNEVDTLNQKMKVLADKLVEYRNDEDSIRAALLNAQRTGDTVLREAEEKAKTLLSDAEGQLKKARADIAFQIEEEEKELVRVKNEVAAFKAQLLTMYKEHLAAINVLPEEDVKETVKTAEPVPAAEQPVPVEQPVAQVTQVVDVAEAQTVVDTFTPPQPEEDMKPLSRFGELKFGNDYSIADDEDGEDDKPRGLFKKRK